MDTTPAVPKEQSTGRRSALAGSAGLVFLVLIAAENVLTAAFGPAMNASTADLAEFTHARAWLVHLLVAAYVIGFPALLVFAVGLSGWCARHQPRSATWAGVGQACAAVIAVLFGLVNVMQVTMVAARSQLAAAPELIHVLWALHNAVFTINQVAVGVALFSLGRAATLSRLIPAWMGPVTGIGGGLLLASALPAVAVVNGSGWLVVGILGFLIWMVFLALAGAALLRVARD